MAWVYLIIAGIFEVVWAIGTAYAIWTGIGALGAVILGIFLFHEPVSFFRIVFLCLILIGILGLKLTSA
jgi:quaternary ammonium compound-resistance protein SugE